MNRKTTGKILIKGILPLLAVFILTVSVMYISYKKRIDEYQQFKTEEMKKEIEVATNTYQRFSDFLFYNTINREEISRLLYESYTDPEKKDKNRLELKRMVDSLYSNITKYEFRQLHFHLPDTESFLRMHKPSTYGDKLESVRETVRITNLNKTVSIGFEEGRIFNGFRYVYPLFYKDKHAGSVEISISFGAVIKSLEELFDKKYIFILKKEIVDEKVFSNEKSNYEPFCINSNYMLDIAVNRKEMCNFNRDNFLNNSGISKFGKKLDLNTDFIHPVTDNSFNLLFTATKLFNFSKKHAGYIISIETPEEFLYIKNNTLGLIIISGIIILLLYILIQYHIWVKIKFEEMAMHDKLTSLYNRHMFLEIFRQTLTRMKRSSDNSVIIMADIDHFKKLNDNFGHNTGDAVLKDVAGIIKNSIRESDILCRWGGEEFIILLPGTTLANGRNIAEKIRANIEKTDFSISSDVTCSFGVAEFSDRESEIKEIIEKADKMLYKSKNNGRNRVEG